MLYNYSNKENKHVTHDFMGESCRRVEQEKKPRQTTHYDIIHLHEVQGQVKSTDGNGSQYNGYFRGWGLTGRATRWKLLELFCSLNCQVMVGYKNTLSRTLKRHALL